MVKEYRVKYVMMEMLQMESVVSPIVPDLLMGINAQEEPLLPHLFVNQFVVTISLPLQKLVMMEI